MYSHNRLAAQLFALTLYSSALSLTLSALPAHAQTPTPLEVPAIVRTTPDKPEQQQLFRGPINTTKTWRLCVVLPNVSDTFWDEVMSGVREESAHLGVDSVIYEASGYSEGGLAQQERILNQRCATGKLDAVLLAAVDRTGLHKSLRRLRAQNVLVIDFVNGYESSEVDARAFLDNYHVGKTASLEIKKYIAEHLPQSSSKKQYRKSSGFPAPKVLTGQNAAMKDLKMH